MTIVGAGATGAAAAHFCARRGLADVILLDVVPGLPQGKALDMQQAAPIEGFDARVHGTGDYADSAGSDVVVITAGVARKPGMSRDDLLETNARIVREVAERAVLLSPDACLVVLTNPLDVMCWVAWRASGLPPARVVGQSGILDSARFRTFLALELGVSVRDVTALVLGGHGDAMVPLVRYAFAGGIPVTELLPRETLERLVERTRFGGGEIVDLMGTSASYAPGAAVGEMVEAILRDEKRILPCSAYMAGEYGQSGIFAGVPVVLGRGGVERVLELGLTAEEAEQFAASCREVARALERVGELTGLTGG